jgi:hypothetical protein
MSKTVKDGEFYVRNRKKQEKNLKIEKNKKKILKKI